VVVLRKKTEALGKPVPSRNCARLGSVSTVSSYLLHTEFTGVAHIAFQAAGLRPPPLAQLLDPRADEAPL